MTRIVDGGAPGQIDRAVAILVDGGVVGFPTETVYGLGAEALTGAALDRIYELKGRPDDNPIIAHVADAEHAAALVEHWDDRAAALTRRFWPGALTLVLRRATHVPDRLTAGRDTIAVRSPAHSVARALIDRLRAAYDGAERRLGRGAVAAPSANRSGGVSPTTARHVAADFAESDLLILDGGPSDVGIESTVLDLGVDPPVILRPGIVTAAQLDDVLGAVRAGHFEQQAASPGTSRSHYAPRTLTSCVDASALEAALGAGPAVVLGFAETVVAPPHEVIELPREAAEYAARLYDALREADTRGASSIVIVRPPDAGGAWVAIHDRIRRATARGRPGQSAV